jgi:hypothetical protein
MTSSWKTGQILRCKGGAGLLITTSCLGESRSLDPALPMFKYGSLEQHRCQHKMVAVFLCTLDFSHISSYCEVLSSDFK